MTIPKTLSLEVGPEIFVIPTIIQEKLLNSTSWRKDRLAEELVGEQLAQGLPVET